MRLMLIGCEYSGGSTMARAIGEWLLRERAATGVRVHDHWVYPYIADQDPSTCFVLGPDGIVSEEWRYRSGYSDAAMSEERASDVRAMPAWLLEQMQRALIWRHMHHTVIDEEVSDSIQVGLYYAEAVYAPLYYGYGRDSFSDRRRRAREWDRALLEIAPETVLVLLRASRRRYGSGCGRRLGPTGCRGRRTWSGWWSCSRRSTRPRSLGRSWRYGRAG